MSEPRQCGVPGCDKPGRSYMNGPACDEHSPWAIAGHPEPPKGYGHEEIWKPLWERASNVTPIRHARSVRTMARRSDPHTSKAAAASVIQIDGVYRRIMGLLAEKGPLTDEELFDLYQDRAEDGVWPGVSPSGLRTRRSELVHDGSVTDTGLTRKTRSGRKTIVWGLSA